MSLIWQAANEAGSRLLARSSLKFFTSYVLKEKFPNEPFHNKWYNEIQDPSRGRILKLAPRGSAKTTCVAKKTPVWMLGSNPNLRILMVSKTSTIATMSLRGIKQTIEGKETVRKVFPGLAPGNIRYVGEKEQMTRPWSEAMLTVKACTRTDGYPSIYAVGLHGSITGMRADLIIVDDLIDKESVMTENQRAKAVEWWNEVVMPVLEPNGRIFAIGTRWHMRDIYSTWIASGEWDVEILTAFRVDEKTQKIVEDEHGLPISYWPNRWPALTLLQRKVELGSLVFNCQYMNDPSGFEGDIFKAVWLRHYNPMSTDFQVIRPRLRVFQGVDPSISESPDADYTAIVTIGLDPQRMDIYILDVWRRQIDFPKQVKAINELSARWKPLKIGIEVVAYQKALERMGYLAGQPVIEIKRSTDKVTRMIGLAPHFENGRFLLPDPTFVHEPWYDDFVSELLGFPRGANDDQLDAFDCAVEAAGLAEQPSEFYFGGPEP